jgi:hypothetical protein
MPTFSTDVGGSPMVSSLARFTVLAAVAGLVACSGSSAVNAPAPSGVQAYVTPLGEHVIRAGGVVIRFGGPRRRTQRRGWLSPAAKKRARLLYGASYDGGFVNIYPLRSTNQSPLGQLTTDLVSPQGIVVDRSHNVWVANTNAFNVLGFARGATTPFATLSDPNYFPISVAVDSNGTVYAANAESTAGPPGNVTYWKKGASSPSGTLTYANFETVTNLGIDAKNNLYVSYIPISGPPAVVEFAAGSQTGTQLPIQDATLGDITFDKSGNLVMETLQNNLGVWAPPYDTGPTRTIPAFGNEPTLEKRENKVWIAYANFSTPMIEGYNYTTGAQVGVITNGWTSSAVPYGVAVDPPDPR